MRIVDGEIPRIAANQLSMRASGDNPESLEAIAARLKKLREASGLKQAVWCRRHGIAVQAWNNYERGRRRISLDEALRLERSAGAPIEWIFKGISLRMPEHMAAMIRKTESGAR